MSNNEQRDDRLKMNATAFLLEFYGKSIVNRFCETCADFGCEIVDALISLKYIVMQNMALEQSYPDFPDLAEMYAEKMELDQEEFVQNFYIPRRDRN
jgi:hypothetical protein